MHDSPRDTPNARLGVPHDFSAPACRFAKPPGCFPGRGCRHSNLGPFFAFNDPCCQGNKKPSGTQNPTPDSGELAGSSQELRKPGRDGERQKVSNPSYHGLKIFAIVTSPDSLDCAVASAAAPCVGYDPAPLRNRSSSVRVKKCFVYFPIFRVWCGVSCPRLTK